MILKKCPKYSKEMGIRTIPPEETLRIVLPLLEIIGTNPLEDITGLDNIGIPVYSVYRDKTAKGSFGNYNGKGFTHDQAKASAVMETIERFCAELKESDEIIYGTYNQAKDNGLTVNPVDLILPIPMINYVNDAEIAWTKGYELLRGEDIWVPACEAFYPYYPNDDLQLYRFHTNGIASGNTIEEAILHGLLELIERDAWSIAEERNIANADIIIDDDDSIPAQLLKKFRENGIKIHLKDLTSDIGIPTIGAATDDFTTMDPELLNIGVGTHLNPEIAAIRAITEVAQSRTTHKHGIKANAKLQTITQEMGYDKIKEVNKIWYKDLEKKINLKDLVDLSTPFVLDDIEIVLDKLVQVGIDFVIVKDLTRPELNIPVVRMTVPGLEVSTMDIERKGNRL